MFGLGNDDNDERFWNLLMFKVFATDGEMKKGAPVLIVLAVLIILTIIGLVIFS